MKFRETKFIYFSVMFMAFFSCKNNQDKKADFVLKNAIIWTGNQKQAEAQALAIKEDKIIFIGNNQDVENFIGNNTKVIDAHGQMVTPGFIDSHVHINEGGTGLASVQLRDANTKQLFIQRIADYAKILPKGTWITGGTWDHTLWGGELPQAAWIDSVTQDNPVAVRRMDGHMSLGNSLALKAANITAQTKDIVGGVIERDANRKPLGVVKDNAQDVLLNAIAPLPDDLKDKAFTMAMDLFVSKGVTSAHNMSSWDDLATFRRLQKNDKLKVRIYCNVPLRTWAKLAEEVKKNGRGDSKLRIGGLKGFVDGALGSHTAAMLEPFTDNHSDKGIFITPPDSLYYFVSNADKQGLNIMVHAIGDNAIRTQLNIFERVIKENGAKDRRFRIEHAQHIAPADIPRFAQLKIIPSMQPYHAIDDGRYAEKYLGYERCKTTYAFKSLFDAGATIAFGSDWFVAPPTPLDGIYAAVTRRTLDDKNPNGWFPAQKISVEQALKAYTINAAYASFQEKEKGSLEVGKLADFVILGEDIRKIAPEKIKDVKIKMTVIGGKVVFENK